jgi:phage terminase large subunit-like protein
LLIADTIINSIMQAQETARERLIMEKDAAIQEMQALGIELSTSQQQITKLEEAIGEVEAKVRESGLRYCGYRRQMK